MTLKLKIAGTWAGVIEVELENWTVPMLREEIARRSNTNRDSINLIYSGRVLRDGDGVEKLSQLGVRNNGKVLSCRVNRDLGKKLVEEERLEESRKKEEEGRIARLNRLKAAATTLAKRHSDGSAPLEDYNLELEDQSGQKVNIGTETDQRGIMMGLMLHRKGKQLIESREYGDALEVLTMGEEAFSLCDSKLTEGVDNVSILLIDIVWCYFMLRDISLLSAAGVRLAKARKGIELAHGKDASRVRLLQGVSSPELALYLRLDLLEGIVAYYGGHLEKSRQLLISARTKLSKLEVSDEALSLIVSMGYKDSAVKRALRMNCQDVDSAISFLELEKERKAKQRAENHQRQKEIMEQKLYGSTSSGRAVDIQRLNELVGIGFERELAAEALIRCENDFHKALDSLTNSDLNSEMQVDIQARKSKREDQAKAHNGTTTTEPLLQGATTSGSSSASTSLGGDDLDLEMEGQLAGSLKGADALSDYNVDVSLEAEAITEYITLLDSILQ
ncbi:NEDD8 ultimate buster 1-like protein [Drosera capensis]